MCWMSYIIKDDIDEIRFVDSSKDLNSIIPLLDS